MLNMLYKHKYISRKLALMGIFIGNQKLGILNEKLIDL